MSHILPSQRLVFKIRTSRLRRAGWQLSLTIEQARENKELIALNDSQLMRFIDELNGVSDSAFRILELKKQIKDLKKEENPVLSRPAIKKLYAELDRCQFQKDYVCVVMDTKKDYYTLCKNGFKINRITYRRLLGTTGGIKNNTIVFVNETLLPELNRRIDNGRDLKMAFTPAKLEAYKALVCSSSVPVSMPEGVIVVPDCMTHFKADVIKISDEGAGEPEMKYVKEKEITLNDSDGYGLAMPALMERWGREIGGNYLLPGCVIRNSFCKGAVFPVDFQAFAKEHNVSYVTDVWGHTHNIHDAELILTASMLKLWDSYSSLDDYLKNCEENHYTFAITKASEAGLEHVRNMNYQFLQSYDFTDAEIDALIEPTVEEIRDILADDYRKTILYTKGCGLTEKSIAHLDNSFSTALMIEPEMRNDPYVKDQLCRMIKKRMDEAKVGVLRIPANYSLVSGDPYSLCQSMFGLEVTGLLKAGEVYSRYWAERGVEEIVSFRAPMTSHNNIRRLKVVRNEKMDAFYQYMTTPTIFNSWDTCADAMNGFDKDGDCVINTAFPLLVKRTRQLPAILCVQRKAPKCIPNEADFIEANIKSFGNAVGEITNKITAMYEVQARFPKDSREYRILDYRIKCGQLYQQNQIDKTKGIEAKDMPAEWYSPYSNKISRGANAGEKKAFWLNRRLTADKKPYFMQYIYPAEQSKLKSYLKKNDEKCLMRFRIPLKQLLEKPCKSREEERFLENYRKEMPLGAAPCTINKICFRLEAIFSELTFARECPDFDYSILKCKDVTYSDQLYKKIKKIYENYKKETACYMQYAKKERIKSEDRRLQKFMFREQFKRQCSEQCPNEACLCNIVLDLCYAQSKSSKQFAWDICGDVFIRNLLKRNGNRISYPVPDKNGDIVFNGMHFSMKTCVLKTNCTEMTP